MAGAESWACGIIAAVAGICVLLMLLLAALSVYHTALTLLKGTRLKAKIVGAELQQASRGQNCCAVVEFECEGRQMQMVSAPFANYIGVFSERRKETWLQRWKAREVTVLYMKPFGKRKAQAYLLRWMWKEIFWEAVMIAILVLAGCAIADRI